MKSRIWEKKEGNYSKTLAKIQVTAVFLKRDIRITFLTQIYTDFYGDVRHAGAWSFPQVAPNFKKESNTFFENELIKPLSDENANI